MEENRPGIDLFVKNIGDNMQQGVKKVQEVGFGLLSGGVGGGERGGGGSDDGVPCWFVFWWWWWW